MMRYREDRGGESSGPLKPTGRILEQEMGLASDEMERTTMAILGSAFLAGTAICVSVLLSVVLHGAGGGELSELARRFLIGNAYAAGFLVVIFARADLFTEYTTITLLPVLFRRSSVRPVARLWGLVYAANLAGALAGAFFLVRLGAAAEVPSLVAFGELGRGLTGRSLPGLLLGAVLAGWLMGLLSWLIVAARGTLSQLVFVWVIGITIGFGHLPHCITGTAEVAAAVMAGTGTGVDAGALGRFLLLSTLGNALGSVVFAVQIRLAARRPAESG